MTRRVRDPERGARILRAAAALFYERGFHAVSVDEIGAAVDATGAAIYRYFESKDEILATLFDHALDRYVAALPDRMEDPWDELDALIDRTLRITLEQRELASVWAREERALSDASRRQIRRRERQLVLRWSECLARCSAERSERELVAAARAVLGAIVAIATSPDVPVIGHPEVAIVRGFVAGGLHSLTGGAEPVRGHPRVRRPSLV